VRLLVLGNSHAASLREALRRGAPAAAEVAVFAGPGDVMARTVFDGGRLVAADAAASAALRRVCGVDAVEVATFDAVAVVGCMMAPATATRIWRDMRWRGLPSVAAAAPAGSGPALVPRAAAAASLRAHLGRSLAAALALRVAPAGRPVIVASQPRASESVLAVPHRLALSAAACARAGDGEALSALYEAEAEAACAAVGAGYLPQPPGTVVLGVLTAARFMRKATRLSARPGLPQPEGDVLHANGAYGALVLEGLLARLG
jgi:hypothetical protein